MPDHVLADGGRELVEVPCAKGIGGTLIGDGVGVAGTDDRGVSGHLAIILWPEPFPLLFHRPLSLGRAEPQPATLLCFVKRLRHRVRVGGKGHGRRSGPGSV
jgi:hypothetical protein